MTIAVKPTVAVTIANTKTLTRATKTVTTATEAVTTATVAAALRIPTDSLTEVIAAVVTRMEPF